MAKTVKCTTCTNLVYIPNPNYISPNDKQTKTFIHKTNNNDNLEEIMQNFSF